MSLLTTSEERWREFVRDTADAPPWPQLERAAGLFPKPGEALDIGAGAGRDTGYLLRQGWRVTAVDASPSAAAALRRLPLQENLTVVESAAEDFQPATYDLVNAQFSLPFIARSEFDTTVRRLRDSVRPGGVMAATFFGMNDEWNVAGAQQTFSTQGDIERIYSGWGLIQLDEVDEDGHTADGTPKHWHAFHVIAQRLQPSSSEAANAIAMHQSMPSGRDARP
jgi:tellurite methyltransferase